MKAYSQIVVYIRHIGSMFEGVSIGLLGLRCGAPVVVDVGQIAPGLGGVDSDTRGVESLLVLPVSVP